MRIALLPTVLWGLAALMVAAIVHLVAILILSQVAPDTAFARLAAATSVNAVSQLPRPEPGASGLPFRDAALASAICRYDLDVGGLKVGIAIGDVAFLAVSFHSVSGVPFYALTNRSGNDGRIDLWLGTTAQVEKIEAADGEDDDVHDVRVTAPDPRGFVQFDVLPRVGGDEAARRALASANCELEPIPSP